jgi:hypothetical protein
MLPLSVRAALSALRDYQRDEADRGAAVAATLHAADLAAGLEAVLRYAARHNVPLDHAVEETLGAVGVVPGACPSCGRSGTVRRRPWLDDARDDDDVHHFYLCVECRTDLVPDEDASGTFAVEERDADM